MMKFDISETTFAVIMCAMLCGGGFYISHLKSRLSDEVDARQAADAMRTGGTYFSPSPDYGFLI